jgi:hypothetical protein
MYVQGAQLSRRLLGGVFIENGRRIQDPPVNVPVHAEL